MFNNGKDLYLTNVEEVKVSPTSHKVTCDQGYVLVERANLLYTIVPVEAKKF